MLRTERVAEPIRKKLVLFRDNTLFVLSEASCVVEKAALDSISLHYDFKQEIPDSEVLTYLAGKASTSLIAVSEFQKRFGNLNVQDKFNSLISEKQKEFDRVISRPLIHDDFMNNFDSAFGPRSIPAQLPNLIESSLLSENVPMQENQFFARALKQTIPSI